MQQLQSHAWLHRIHFHDLEQHASENVAYFAIRLKSAARDWDFCCPSAVSHVNMTKLNGMLNTSLLKVC